MHRLIQFTRFFYLSIFTKLTYGVLRRKKRVLPSGQASDTFKIVARYGRQSGITNGAIYNSLALEALGYKVEQVNITPAMRNPFKQIPCGESGIFVFHCAAPDFLRFAWPLRRVFGSGKMVGYFAWEFADPPKDWPKYNDLWDEIWTPSSFSARSLAKLYDCPIRVVPHVLLKQGSPRAWKKSEEPLVFLSMADSRSSLARKNPRAAVAAFRKAFPDESDVVLIIKLQAGRVTGEMEKLFSEIAVDPRIRVIQDTLSRADVDQLFLNAHVFVSLHRGEGFGLPLLEARLFGLATIATAWSGNLDFMSAQDSVLISCKLETTRDEGGVYGEITWADPDVEAAAAAMRHFYRDPAYLAEIARAGWEASQPEKQLAHLKEALKGYN